KGRWSDDEDAILRTGFEKYGCCWVKIANLISGRTQRQCRTRWLQLSQKKRGHSRSNRDSKRDEECESVMSDEESPAISDDEIINNDKENQSEMRSKRLRLRYTYEFCDENSEIDKEAEDVDMEFSSLDMNISGRTRSRSESLKGKKIF
ncbi:hypothetical protein HK096_003671, partial [Nowakowskiella sp. JEL0078]